MSHATLTVVLPGTLSPHEIKKALEKALAPYDENLEVERYLKYTREQLTARERAEMEEFRDSTYVEYLADPAAYVGKGIHIGHLEYLAGGTEAARLAHPETMARLEAERAAEMERYEAASEREKLIWGAPLMEPLPFDKSFPARLHWTDEQFYEHAARWYEPEEFSPEGGVYSDRNPLSKWDWWVIGGRWAGYWKVVVSKTLEFIPHMSEPAWETRYPTDHSRAWAQEMNARPGPRTDVARKCDIDFAAPELPYATHALLDSEGEWHERGRLGWFGTFHGDTPEKEWHARYAELVAKESDNAWFVMVDYHI